MIKVHTSIDQICIRFARGLLQGLPPEELRIAVTGSIEDEDQGLAA
jgi:hypothetical protein